MFHILSTFVCSVLLLQSTISEASEVTDIFLKPCKATDLDCELCWIQKIEDLRPHLITGIEELHIPPIDPLYLSKLSVGKRMYSVISYQAVWKNIVFSGAKGFQILSVTVDPLKLIFKLKFTLPSLNVSVIGDEVEGNVLGFSFQGEGRVELFLTNVVIDLVFDGEGYTKDEQEYIQWKEGSFELSYGTATFKVYDIIKDPFELLKFNHVINANINAFKGAIRSFIDRTVASFITRAINSVHEIFSVEMLYPTSK